MSICGECARFYVMYKTKDYTEDGICSRFDVALYSPNEHNSKEKCCHMFLQAEEPKEQRCKICKYYESSDAECELCD